MNDDEHIRAIVEAVEADGFTPRFVGDALWLEGDLKVREHTVPLRLEFEDFSLSSSPTLRISDLSSLPRPVMPHVDHAGELCAVNRTMYVFDRYRAAQQVRGLLVRAREVLERGLTKAAIQDIADEFPQHWGPRLVYLDLAFLEGPVEFQGNRYVVVKQSKAPTGWLVSTKQELSFGPTQARPESLEELLHWAGPWDAQLPERIMGAFSRLSAADPIVFISAPNGIIGSRLLVSKNGKAFQSTLQRPVVWKRMVASLPARKWRVDRVFARRADLKFVLGKNGNGMAPLTGKRVVLVGCGAIGGFLSRMLAQVGAGLDDGLLLLVDPDDLNAINIRRHALGSAEIGQSKAKACKAAIETSFPGLRVFADVKEIQSDEGILSRADLIIDATGEQGVSEMLNDRMLSRQARSEPTPPLLHVWIEGNGAAVQTFLNVDVQFACYRCLEPEHGKPRFRPLKETPDEPVAACGEQPFTPYGPAAPTMAAALATQHAVDWINGRARPLLRSIVLNHEQANDIGPKNPVAKPQCPACHRAI